MTSPSSPDPPIDGGRCVFCDHERHRDRCLAHRVFSTELCDCQSYVPWTVFFPNAEHQVDEDDDGRYDKAPNRDHDQSS